MHWMPHWIRYPAAIFAAVLLFGCDNQGRPVQEFGLDKLAKGISSEADVRMVMGQPETVREEADGSRTLEYPKGPEGARTWMFSIGQSGTLTDYKQVLTEDNFARIKAGMSQEDVRRMLGKPRSLAQYKLKNEEVWDWKYMTDSTTAMLFNVHFDMSTRRVTRTSTSPATNY